MRAPNTAQMMRLGMALAIAYRQKDRQKVQRIVETMDAIERRYLVRFLNWVLAIVDG